MKMSANPMPDAKAAAIDQVNGRFAAAANPHRDRAHDYKRAVAAAVIAGGQAPPEFSAEAALRGISALQLAELVASKPNNIAARELERQQLLMQIDQAASPAAIATILAGSQG